MSIFFAVLLAVVSNTALGIAWYGPIFGDRWMKLMGMTKEDTAGSGLAMGMATGVGAVGLAAMAYLLQQNVVLASLNRFENALLTMGVGFLLAIIIAAVQFNPVSYGKDEGFGDRLKLWYIHIGYTFASVIIASFLMGLVL